MDIQNNKTNTIFTANLNCCKRIDAKRYIHCLYNNRKICKTFQIQNYHIRFRKTHKFRITHKLHVEWEIHTQAVASYPISRSEFESFRRHLPPCSLNIKRDAGSDIVIATALKMLLQILLNLFSSCVCRKRHILNIFSIWRVSLIRHSTLQT